MPLFNLFLLLALIVALNGQCLQEIISNTQYKCGKKSVLDSSSANFPSKLTKGASELGVSGTIRIEELCSGSYPFNLLTIKVLSEDQQEFTLVTYQITGANNITVFNQDRNGVYQMNSLTTAEPVGQNSSIEFSIGLSTTSGVARVYSAMSFGFLNFGAYSRNYTDLKFDQNTRFEICADSSGNSAASCTVQSFVVEYQYSILYLGWMYSYFGGFNPVLVGSYTLDQKSGMMVQDQARTLGTAQLGSATTLMPNGKAPKWLSGIYEAGVEFIDADQYILLPTFIPISVSPLTRFCFTLSFWLKIENETNSGYIFRYSHSNGTDLTQNVFAISLNGQQLIIRNGAYQSTSGSVIPYSAWNLMTFTYTCFNIGAKFCYTQIFINSTLIMRPIFYATNMTLFSFQSSDVVLLGGPDGFKGKIAQFRIFNPGSQRLIVPNCESSSACLINLGVIDSTNKNCLKCSANMNTTKFYEGCRTCPSGTYLSGEQCLEEKKEVQTFPGAAASKGTAAAAKGATQAVSAVSSGSSSGASAAISGKVFSNIKFINISYSNELENALTTWTPNYFSLGFNTDMPDSLEKRFVNASVPYVFAKNQVNSCFLINFWEPLMMLLMLVLFLIVILLLDWAISLKKNISKKSLGFKIITRAKVMILNFLIVQLYGLYGDVVFYALIDFQNTQPTAGLNLLSIFSIIFLVAAMLFGFFLHLNLLRRYQNVKKHFGGNPETKKHFDDFLTDHAGIQVIFGDFKDHSLIHQSFLFFLTIRDILFSIILTTLFEHPLTECILILMMNIAMLLYLFIKRPFKEKIAQVQQVVLELITMVVNINILILAVWDNKGQDRFDQRKTIGKILIIINMVFNFTIVFFMLFNLFIQGWEVYKEYKEKNKGKRLKLKAPRNLFNLQDTSSLETRKGGFESDVKVTDFVRNNSETCLTMMKTQFDDTVVINHDPPQISFLNEPIQILERSIVINSTKDGGGGGLGDGGALTRTNDLKRSQLRKKRRLNNLE